MEFSVRIQSICWLLVLLFYNVVHGQQSVKFESVIPPSPNASAIGKFGETPVDLFTGIPEIGVPLFNYAGGSNNLKLNVALRYHAGGIKVAEVSSYVGLGWALNAGGVISRTIYGLADFSPVSGGFQTPSDTLPSGSGSAMRVRNCAEWTNIGSASSYTDNSPCYDDPRCVENTTDFFTIRDVANGVKDGQYDVFSYSFEGYSGKFIIGKNDSILQMPQTNLRITRISNPANLTGFIITTPEGTQYVFRDQEFNNYNIRTCGWAPSMPISCPGTGFNQEISSWYLTKVYSPSGIDSISFSYEGGVLKYDADLGESYYHGPIGSPLNYYSKSTAYHGDIAGFIPNEMRVKSIKLPNNTSVEFEYDTDHPRLDLKPNGHPYALRKIIITSNNIPAYHYQLFHSYFAPSGRVAYDATRPSDDYNYRLALDSIKKISGSSTLPYYKFAYEPNLPGRFSNAQDHWGFYNGETGNVSLIPDPYRFKANRNAHQFTAKYGSLNKITYPTGGSTSFDYETNFGPTGHVGGIRVAKTVDFDGISHSNDVTTEYTYSLATSTNPKYDYFFLMRGSDGLSYPEAYSSFSNITLGQVHGSPATYEEVTVSKTKATVKLGKVISNYQNEGRTLYNGGFDPEYVRGYPYLPIPYLDWADGLIKRQRYYDDQDNLLKEVTYDYDVKKIKAKNSYFKAMKAARLVGPYECGSGYCNSDCTLSFYQVGNTVLQEKDYIIYTRSNYYPYTGRTDLIKTTEILYYAGGNNITTESNFTYHGTYYLPLTKEVTNSKNEVLKTSFKYPFDLLPSTVYQKMVQRNMISPVVELRVTNSNSLLQFTRTNFLNPTGNIIIPGSIESNYKNFPVETLLKFNVYDLKGNILERQTAANIKEVFVWGYYAQYPVAKIIGSDWNTVKALVDTSILNNGTESQIITQLTNLRTVFASNPLVQIETYLFNPLSGITKTTDAKGINTYYEYDVFNRLHLVKDHNGNILKRICYNYAGEIEDCGLPAFKNEEQTGSFTRNNCGSGYIGTNVDYTVPAGTYASTTSQAHANQLALNDIAANGQNFANANGSCTQVCTVTMGSGFISQMTNFTKSGTTVNFNWIFSSTSPMNPSTTYTVGVLVGCWPVQNTTFTYNMAGRTYQVIIDRFGVITARITSGTALPAGQPVYITGTYTGN